MQEFREDTNDTPGTHEQISDSKLKRNYQDTEEFINEEQKDYLNSASNDAEEPMVADEGYQEETPEGHPEGTEPHYIFNSETGEQEFIDAEGNRYVYAETDFDGPIHTKMRAEERDQVRYEREMQSQQEKFEKERAKQERHRVKVAAIAEKSRSRAFPYGLNYSENAGAAQQEVEDVENQIVYKKIDSESLKAIIQDKNKKDAYLIPSGPKKQRVARNQEVERLFKNNTSSKEAAELKKIDRIAEIEEQMPKVKTTKNKINAKEIDQRMSDYQRAKNEEMRLLTINRERDLKKETQQFKACKGSKRIVKTLFKKEKEYSKPVHKRLYKTPQDSNSSIKSTTT